MVNRFSFVQLRPLVAVAVVNESSVNVPPNMDVGVASSVKDLHYLLLAFSSPGAL